MVINKETMDSFLEALWNYRRKKPQHIRRGSCAKTFWSQSYVYRKSQRQLFGKRSQKESQRKEEETRKTEHRYKIITTFLRVLEMLYRVEKKFLNPSLIKGSWLHFYFSCLFDYFILGFATKDTFSKTFEIFLVSNKDFIRTAFM